MMDEQAKEVMRITRTGIWVNPDIAVDEVAKAVLESIDENIKFLVQRAVEDEREACARLCEDIESEAYGKHRQKYDPYDEGFAAGALACIEAIRAGGNK